MANRVIEIMNSKNPVKVLYDEHEIIISAITVSKAAQKLIADKPDVYEKVIIELIAFFRQFADQYHHYKEEIILFPEMNKKNELLEDGVIKEMFNNHEEFRDMLAEIENCLNKKDYANTQVKLNNYCEALLDHIAVENDEVFQMAESLFNEDELEKIYFKFEDCDRDKGELKKNELVMQLAKLKTLVENS